MSLDHELIAGIAAYCTSRAQFLSAEQTLFDQIGKAFQAEIPMLNQVLSTHNDGIYIIDTFKVERPDDYMLKPFVMLTAPYNDGKPADSPDRPRFYADPLANSGLFPGLNKVLAQEYQRIEQKYGFAVQGFVMQIQMP